MNNTDRMKKVDPERVRTLMALYDTMQRCKASLVFCLAAGAWCLILWLALGMTTGLGIATALCGAGALLADWAHKRARKMWDKLCPCPGCEARRARERGES